MATPFAEHRWRGPTRVLHLLDVRSPRGGPCTRRLIADVIARLQSDRPDQSHDVLLIGQHADVIESTACGLHAIGSIWPRRGRALSAARMLRRWLEHARVAGAAPDVIHAWTASTGALAAIGAPDYPRVVTPRPLGIDPQSPHVLSREQVRERWLRDHGVQEDEFVLGVLGEPVERFDARRAIHVGARTALSSRRIRMVMSGRCLGRAEAQRFVRMLDLDHVIVQDECVSRPWEVLRGLDAVLLLAPTPERDVALFSSMPLLWSCAAGVPVIAERNAPLDGLVEHDRTGFVFAPGDFNFACDGLGRLHDDPALAQRLARAAAQAAASRCHIAVFCTRLAKAYQRAVDECRAQYLTDAPVPEDYN